MYATLFAALLAGQGEQPNFAAFDARLTAVEQRVAALEAQRPASAPTYAEARARAIAENKPLVAWVGGGDALCVACVRTLADEAVHYIADSFPDTPAQALVVAVPENGELWRIATITSWQTSDPVWGHTPSIRRAIRAWRERRQVTRSGWSLEPSVASVYQPASPVMRQPMMRQVMASMACASCR